MQFDSKSVALEDRNKRRVDVETNNEAVGVTQRVKDKSIRCLNHFPTTLGALSLLMTTGLPALASDGPGGGPRANNGPGCNLFPAAASTGTRVPLSYFGPPPAETNPSLVGPEQELKSGQLDAINGRITLPLYLGYITGTKIPVWYILTDVSDQGQAAQLGLNYSAKLEFAGIGARTAHFGTDNVLFFDKGKVDFTPHRVLTPGTPNAYPPAQAAPGSVGDKNYSPLVNIDGIIYDAPIVAFNVPATAINFPNGNVDYTKVHDEVVAIDPVGRTVTLQLVNGFSFGRPVWYLRWTRAIPPSPRSRARPTLLSWVNSRRAATTASTAQSSASSLPKTALWTARTHSARVSTPPSPMGSGPTTHLAGSRRLLSTTARLGH